MVHLEFDFSHRENNRFSEGLQEENFKQISKNCMLVLELLNQGKRLTVNGAVIDYGISSLPRRIKDLTDKLGIEIKRNVINKKYVEYYLENPTHNDNSRPHQQD
jgi:hypothetical protein